MFGNEYFGFSNYKVAECITGEGRTNPQIDGTMAKQAPFNFDIVFGFTDSVFVKVNEGSSEDKIKHFIADCKEEFGITVEIKNVFQNSIFYGKKNRFVGWTGKESEQPTIKGFDGLADSNPLWVRKWFHKIVNEVVKRPDIRYRNYSKVVKGSCF